MRFLVIGAGAIGGVVATHLVERGNDVLLCDSNAAHLEAIARDGLRIQGLSDRTTKFDVVQPDQLAELLQGNTFDYIAVSVKAQATEAVMKEIAPFLKADQVILTLQNGLTAGVIERFVKPENIVSAFINFGADVVAPGVIDQGNAATVRVGEWSKEEITDRVEQLAQLIPYAQPTANIKGFLWAKLGYGAILTGTAVSDLSIADALDQPSYSQVFITLASEVIDQAPVRCEPFDGFDPYDIPGSIAHLVDLNRKSGKSFSGIYRDLAIHKRSTEVAALFANLDGQLLHLTLDLVKEIEIGNRICQRANLDLLSAYEATLRLAVPLNAIDGVISAPRRSHSGPLLGLAIAVKDIADIEGQPRGNGNPHDLKNPPATSDAPLVAALRELGADIFARTSLLEYAAGAVHPGSKEARNPANPATTAGGSSGGSASIVGSGAALVAIGTDTGGSIRIPAHYCNIFGLKPSYGLLPLEGITPLSPTFDHPGFLTANLELMKRVMAPFAKDTVVAKKALRVGYIPAHFTHSALTDEVKEVVQKALRDLEAKGAELVEVDGSIYDQLNELFGAILLFEAWQVHRDKVTSDPDHFGPETLRLFLQAKEATESEYRAALARRAELLPQAEAIFDQIDLLFTPAVPYTAPKTTPPIDTPMGEVEGLYTSAFNITGDPALVVPVGVGSSGLPIGVQFVARIGTDNQLLADVEQLLS